MLDEHLEHVAQRGPRRRSLARVSGILLEPAQLDERGRPVGAMRVDLLAEAVLVHVAEPDPSPSRHSTLLLRHVPSLACATAAASRLESQGRHSRAAQPEYRLRLRARAALRLPKGGGNVFWSRGRRFSSRDARTGARTASSRGTLAQSVRLPYTSGHHFGGWQWLSS